MSFPPRCAFKGNEFSTLLIVYSAILLRSQFVWSMMRPRIPYAFCAVVLLLRVSCVGLVSCFFLVGSFCFFLGGGGGVLAAEKWRRRTPATPSPTA